MQAKAMNYIKPACAQIARSVQISAMIEIVVIVIIFIMLVFAASYNGAVNPVDTEEMAKKEKYINGLIISSAVISFILLAVGIWHVWTSGRMKTKCGFNNLS